MYSTEFIPFLGIIASYTRILILLLYLIVGLMKQCNYLPNTYSILQVLSNLRLFLTEEEKRLQEADSMYRNKRSTILGSTSESSPSEQYDIKQYDAQSG